MSLAHTKRKRIAFAGGGSGGHILPILSLLQYIDDHDECRKLVHSVYRFGEKKGMEYDFYQKYKEKLSHLSLSFLDTFAGKYRRETIFTSWFKNIRDVFLFPLGIFQSLWYLSYYRIEVVFCKGGYVALPVVIAARILRKKVVVHDSDTTPGLTTRFASRFSSKNFSGFPDTLPRAVCVGQILSDALLDSIQSQSLSDSSDIVSVLIAGGSLGSKKLYSGVLAAIKKLGNASKKYRFVFINGKNIIDKDDLPTYSDNIDITDLIKDQSQMGSYYANADVAIVRGGTTTLAECKLFQLPLLIVPLPVTHDQQKNADFYKNKYNDIVVSQNDQNFVNQLYQFISSASLQSKNYDYDALLHDIQSAKKIITKEVLGY